MPAAADLVWRYSGGGTNIDPLLSLGGALSTQAGATIDDNVLHDLFELITGAERTAGYTDYRAFYVRNEHATQTAYGAFLWISTDNTEIDIALATEAVSSPIANTIASRTTAPTGSWLSGGAFSHPLSEGAGLSIGDIPAGGYKGIWIRRTIAAGSSSIPSDLVALSLSFDSD